MKRFLILLLLLFCNTVCADTINLHWLNYDGSTYQDSTCVIDSDLILPTTTPTRYGYTFTGWKLVSYRPIEYLESTGTQYINTGYTPKQQGYTAVGKMRFVGSQNSWAGVLGGDFPSVAAGNKFGRYSTTNNWVISSGSDYSSTSTFDIGQDYLFQVSFVHNDKYLKINNEKVISTQDAKYISNNGSIYIFTYNRSSSLTSESMKGRIYYVKIYDDNNNLVRDFIPVLDENGTPCMYDKFEDKFYYNQGTGQFIAGPTL